MSAMFFSLTKNAHITLYLFIIYKEKLTYNMDNTNY